MFDATGSAVSSVLTLNNDQANDQGQISLAALGNGGFAATWASYDPGRINSSIQARLFDSSGTSLTGDIAVSSASAGNNSPTVAVFADGSFAVAYRGSLSGNGVGSNINARVFDASGVASGAIFTTNGLTSYSDAYAPRLARLADGNLALGWVAYLNGSPVEVLAQIFTAGGARVGGLLDVAGAANGTVGLTATDSGFAIVYDQRVASDLFNPSAFQVDSALRLYTNSGVSVQPAFVINQTLNGDQATPTVTAFGSHDLALGFVDRSSDASGNVSYRLLFNTPLEATGLHVQNDFNGDGRSDVLLMNTNGAVTNWLGQADGTFFSNHQAASYSLPAGWHIAATGDVNGDGRADLILRHDNGAISEWLGASGGTFDWNSHFSPTLAASWHVAGMGDFDGDGRADLLLRNDNGAVTNWLGQADGTFLGNAAATYALPAGWTTSAVGDFNGDGRADILLRNSADGSVTEWLGQAGGLLSWNAPATYALATGWTVEGTGDFNGDGRADLLLRYTNGVIIDWLGQADGTFASNHANTTYALDPSWKVAQFGDFNGDGRTDVLLRNDSGAITEWLGTANGGFSWNQAAVYNLATAWHPQPDLHAVF